MATLEKRRPAPIRTSSSRRTSIGPPSASPTILRTSDSIILPSVPTHEPEDGLPSPIEYQHQIIAGNLDDFRRSSDEQRDHWDEMEELRDEQDELSLPAFMPNRKRCRPSSSEAQAARSPVDADHQTSFSSFHSGQSAAPAVSSVAEHSSIQPALSVAESVTGSLPPAYWDNDVTLSGKDSDKQHRRSSSLPSYSDHAGFSAVYADEKKSSESLQDPIEPFSCPLLASTSAYAARTSQDLLVVQNSIDRLYTAMPQLVNQRAVMSPARFRQDSLEKFMDRLADNPRLKDQCASPPTLQASRLSTVASPSMTLPPPELNGTKARTLSAAAQLGRKFSVSSLANSFRLGSLGDTKGKGKDREDIAEKSWDGRTREQLGRGKSQSPESLEMLFESVRRAQEMSLSDQRSKLPVRSPRAENLIGETPVYTGRQSAVESDGDILFELLNNTGRSRLANQDAKLLSPSSRMSARRASHPILLRPVGETRTLDSSLSGTTSGALKEADSGEQEMRETSNNPFATTRPRTTSDPRLSESSTSLSKASNDTSSSAIALSDADRPSSSRIAYVAESQASLSVVTIMVWLTGDPDPERDATRAEPLDNANQCLSYTVITSEDPGIVSSTCHSSKLVSLTHPTLPEPVTVTLPTFANLLQQGTVPISQDHYSIKLTTAPTTNPSDQATHTPLRSNFASSEPVTFPLSAQALQAKLPSGISCSSCRSLLADTSTSTKYRALPSQHWEELVDAWMCHGDQELNESVARGKQGLEEGKCIPDEEVWVGDQYLVLPGETASEASLEWKQQDLVQSSTPAHTFYQSDHSSPLICRSCHSELGVLILSQGDDGSYPTATIENCTIKFSKFAIRLTGHVKYESNLGLMVAAQMLETSRAHAAHHSLVDDGKRKMLPAFQLSTHILAPAKAVKVLFQPYTSSSVSVEPLPLPPSKSNELLSLLSSNNLIYPPSRRTFGLWSISWLPRLDEHDSLSL